MCLVFYVPIIAYFFGENIQVSLCVFFATASFSLCVCVCVYVIFIIYFSYIVVSSSIHS